MKVISFLVFIFSVSSYASGINAVREGGNGGGISLMRKDVALDLEEMQEVLTEKSHLLKRTASNLIRFTRPKETSEGVVREIFKEMITSKEYPVHDDIIFANYSISQEDFAKHCDDPSLEACTVNFKPGATIFFNLQNLVDNQASFADLIGLILHEHSRHYCGSKDKRHKFANFFRVRFLQGKDQGLIYTLENGLIRNNTYYSAEATHRQKRDADEFCRYKGHTAHISYKLSTLNTGPNSLTLWHIEKLNDNHKLEAIRTRPFYNYRGSPNIPIFKEIICY